MVAFLRRDREHTLLVAVRRLCSGFIGEMPQPAAEAFADTIISLPPDAAGDFADLFAEGAMQIEGRVPVADLFSRLPVAAFVHQAKA